MSQIVPAETAPLEKLATRAASYRALLPQLMWLAVPVMAEHLLHSIVGLTDTYLANHLPAEAVAATAAVGTVAYILWFLSLIVGAVGTGSTAIIARAIGARHRSLANSVCGQSVTSAILLGIFLGACLFIFAGPIVQATRLSGEAQGYAMIYLRMLAFALPFSTLMFVANACQRGAGDTLTPAIVMIIVDIVNIVFSFALTFGWWGFPEMGFAGIAAGTIIAYVTGGLIQSIVLIGGWSRVRLHLHRLRPHAITLKRIFRIGIPAGTEGLLTWIAQFAIVIIINQLDPTNTWPAAHINAIRIEGLSFMCGFAFATAAATMVGQSLGMRDPDRARRSANLAYLVGGGIMTFFGLLFIFFPQYPARLITADAQIAALTAWCLFIVGFVQSGFAASAVFSGALRGAGDTMAVMLINLVSIVLLRLGGVLVVTLWMGWGLLGIWVVLSMELMVRGGLVYARFRHGGWRHVKV